MVVFTFSVLDLKYLFWANLAQNSKLSVEAEIWYLDYVEYVKFDYDIHFFCVENFLQVLSKKSIWHFSGTWLIS